MTHLTLPGSPSDRPLPVHRQIVADIEARIVAGDWAPGRRIPTEHELAVEYACSRMTVNRAMTALATAGLVERRRKTGSVVAWPAARTAALEITDTRREVEATGRTYHHVILDRTVLSASPRDLEWPETPAVTPILRVRVLHIAGEHPFCFEDRLISLVIVPDALVADFTIEAPSAWLLRAISWTDAEHRISAAGATEEIAARLDLPVHAPVLVIDRRTWNAEHPVTRTRLIYPSTAHSLVARFSPRVS